MKEKIIGVRCGVCHKELTEVTQDGKLRPSIREYIQYQADKHDKECKGKAKWIEEPYDEPKAAAR